MTLADLVGYLAALLVLITFYMRSMVVLRCTAIASNMAFIAYGYLGDLVPVLALHLMLVPLNPCRLVEGMRLRGSPDDEMTANGDAPTRSGPPSAPPEATDRGRRGIAPSIPTNPRASG